jgi:hypothetical protein
MNTVSRPQQITPRFMIDYVTYRELHPDAPVFAKGSRDDLGEQATDSEEPPEWPFILQLPATIDGFAIQDKKWSTS